MWLIKRVENQDYLCNIIHDIRGQKFIIFMATLEEWGPTELWKSEQNEDEVICTMKEINPLFDFVKDAIIAEVIDLFNDSRTDVIWKIAKEDTQLKLRLDSTCEGFDFAFEATLHMCGINTCGQTLMLPLLVIIKNLQHQKDQLVEIVKKKDEEIAEYKMNGTTVTRKNIETLAFKESYFDGIFAEKSCNAAPTNAKDLFNKYVISHLNKIQHMIGEELKKKQDIQSIRPNVEENQQVPELEREQSDAEKMSVSEIIPETNRSEEKMVEKMAVPKVGTILHKTKPVNIIHKSKPVKRLLKNL